jgi:hypothetical protein
LSLPAHRHRSSKQLFLLCDKGRFVMIQRFLKWCVWTVLFVLGLAFCWLALALILSRFDEAPTPEVQAALADAARPVDWSEANGFAWLAGLDAPRDRRASEFGRERLGTGAPVAAAEASNEQDAFGQPLDFAAGPGQAPGPSFDALRCKRNLKGVNCQAWYAARRKQLELRLLPPAAADQRYSQMLLAPKFEEPVLSIERAAGVPWAALDVAGERYLARALMRAADGQGAAAADTVLAKLAFERRALAASRSLTAKLIWAGQARNSLFALADLHELQPKLAGLSLQHAALAEPLSAAELSMAAVMPTEILAASSVLGQASAQRELAASAQAAQRITGWMSAYLIRKQATINEIARRHLAQARLCEGPATTLAARGAEAQADFGTFSPIGTLAWPRNLAGDVLIEVSTVNWASLCRRGVDTEALRRMVFLQASKMTGAVQADLRDPTTEQPFALDAAGTELRYVGTASGESSEFVVRLPQQR